MARIRHIALVVKDLDKTADFYEKAFGLTRSEKSEGPTAHRIYMSDGEVNLALLQYKGETGSGLKTADSYVGIHHFGFQCDDIENQQKRIEGAGGKFFFDLGDPDDDDFERIVDRRIGEIDGQVTAGCRPGGIGGVHATGGERAGDEYGR